MPNEPTTLPLHGSCACSRNQYTIHLPSARASILSSTSLHASPSHPLTPSLLYLRVPLDWYSSATFAAYPDESHNKIRRSYHSGRAGGLRRQFCGFCGTSLVRWDEEGEGVVDVAVGSLGEGSLGLLERVGLLGDSSASASSAEEDDEEDDDEGEEAEGLGGLMAQGGSEVGPPFVEEVTDLGRRGRIRRRKGGHASGDGRTTVEWEVVEMEGGEDGDLVMEESAVHRESGGSERHQSKRVKIGD